MQKPSKSDAVTLIEHKKFSATAYKQQFVKSFLERSDCYTKPSFSRSSKLKVASALYDKFFLHRRVDITPSLQQLQRYKKNDVTPDFFLSDLFLSF